MPKLKLLDSDNILSRSTIDAIKPGNQLEDKDASSLKGRVTVFVTFLLAIITGFSVATGIYSARNYMTETLKHAANLFTNKNFLSLANVLNKLNMSPAFGYIINFFMLIGATFWSAVYGNEMLKTSKSMLKKVLDYIKIRPLGKRIIDFLRALLVNLGFIKQDPSQKNLLLQDEKKLENKEIKAKVIEKFKAYLEELEYISPEISKITDNNEVISSLKNIYAQKYYYSLFKDSVEKGINLHTTELKDKEKSPKTICYSNIYYILNNHKNITDTVKGLNQISATETKEHSNLIKAYAENNEDFFVHIIKLNMSEVERFNGARRILESSYKDALTENSNINTSEEKQKDLLKMFTDIHRIKIIKKCELDFTEKLPYADLQDDDEKNSDDGSYSVNSKKFTTGLFRKTYKFLGYFVNPFLVNSFGFAFGAASIADMLGFGMVARLSLIGVSFAAGIYSAITLTRKSSSKAIKKEILEKSINYKELYDSPLAKKYSELKRSFIQKNCEKSLFYNNKILRVYFPVLFGFAIAGLNWIASYMAGYIISNPLWINDLGGLVTKMSNTLFTQAPLISRIFAPMGGLVTFLMVVPMMLFFVNKEPKLKSEKNKWTKAVLEGFAWLAAIQNSYLISACILNPAGFWTSLGLPFIIGLINVKLATPLIITSINYALSSVMSAVSIVLSYSMFSGALDDYVIPVVNKIGDEYSRLYAKMLQPTFDKISSAWHALRKSATQKVGSGFSYVVDTLTQKPSASIDFSKQARALVGAKPHPLATGNNKHHPAPR